MIGFLDNFLQTPSENKDWILEHYQLRPQAQTKDYTL